MAGRGKGVGSKNFQSQEDVWIAKSYKAVTTDASIGTDQDGEAYYRKIAESFNEAIASTADFVCVRTYESIRARWLNHLQKSLLKFAGCLTKALQEYHSGWSWEDYHVLAKRYYAADQRGKSFSADLSWQEVKDMPKFAIDYSAMCPAQKAALLLDNLPSDDADIPEVDKTQIIPGSSHSSKSVAMARRPSVGKKQGKQLKFSKLTDEADASQASRLAVLDRMASSNEMNVSLKQEALLLKQEQYKLKLFGDDSPEALEYLAIKRRGAMLEARILLRQQELEYERLMGDK